jgi:hypothetical protein
VQNYRHGSVPCKVGLLFLKKLKTCGTNLVMVFSYGGSLDNGYFDNLDNGFSNKFEKKN